MIFISYSWIREEPDENVLKLVPALRNDGYDAICDIMLVQKESSIHFTKMMAECLKDADKVLIVLTEKYKEKADSFQGGVGDEYPYIIEDIKNNRQKYILVTFNEDRNSVSPDFLRGREIIVLNKLQPSNNDTLLHRINQTDQYILPPVSDTKKFPSTKNIITSSSPDTFTLLKNILRGTNRYSVSNLQKEMNINEDDIFKYLLILGQQGLIEDMRGGTAKGIDGLNRFEWIRVLF